MPSIATLAARVASAKDHGERETAGNSLIRLIRTGGSDATEAFDALCEALTNDIFYYYSLRVSDKCAARSMTLGLVGQLRTEYRDGRLPLEPEIGSFFAHVLSQARLDVKDYAATEEPAATSNQDDQEIEVPSVGALAGSLELVGWLSQAAAEIPDELENTLLAYTQDLSPDELIAVTGIPPSDLDETVNDSKVKVIERFLCLYIARTRGISRDDADEKETCPELISSLSSLGDNWDQWSDFNTDVYLRIRRHIHTCNLCRPVYREIGKIALRRSFLAIPQEVFPTQSCPSDSLPESENATAGTPVSPKVAEDPVQVAIEMSHLAAEQPQDPHPACSGPPSQTTANSQTPAPPAQAAKGDVSTKVLVGIACIAAIALVVLASIFAWGQTQEPELGPQGTPVRPGAETPTSADAPPVGALGERADQAVGTVPQRTVGLAPDQTSPATKPTRPSSMDDPTEAPSPPLEISLSVSSAVCVPALTCEPIHSCSDCSLDFIGDCSLGVLVSAQAAVKVNRGPATIKYRWVVNGSPVASDSITFSRSGQQSTWRYRTGVVNRLSGSWTARFEVLSPKSMSSNTVRSAVTCRAGCYEPLPTTPAARPLARPSNPPTVRGPDPLPPLLAAVHQRGETRQHPISAGRANIRQ